MSNELVHDKTAGNGRVHQDRNPTGGDPTGGNPTGGDPRDSLRLMEIAAGGCASRVLAVAARLRIADVLDGGFLSADEIAARTGADRDVLPLLLHVLVSSGVFERDEKGAFGLAPGSAALRSDHPGSLRNFLVLLAETYDDAFGGLLGTALTGRSGFEQVFGVPFYEYLGRTPEAEGVFDAAMAELAVPAAAALVERFDFSGVRRVVDVGGGDGTMITSILAGNPHLEGVCVDRPSVCERAGARLAATAGHPLAGRLSFRPSDIFREVSEGGDLYLLKNVLHDWSHENGVRILTAVRRAMTRTARTLAPGLPRPRLIVLEPLLGAEADAAHSLFRTVVCGKGTGGFERHDDLRALLGAAEFGVLSVERLSSGHHAFECSPS
ncbi:methyltransferase [Streptomyces sp. NPDC056987]|uniref:methyltransferase n=1 Tax=Streptomyces sp. NPDC056987 TaxID=3345988 RepID=UPI003639A417